ncbi:MAG: PLDc N-terminal domain-containing protein [Oscillospiraceae bacterium]|nr:PLDc N-terminal domain-containing protein [Oscillospiraceae bacterium]
MDVIKQYIAFIIPLAVIELGLLVFVIVDIAVKRRTKTLNPLIWIIIAIVLSGTMIIGPILYIIFGRAEPTYKDDDI